MQKVEGSSPFIRLEALLRTDPERIAHNEDTFRRLNEHIREGRDGDELAAFVCECHRGDCEHVVALTVAEYEEVRRWPDRFVVVNGHHDPEVERLVAEHERYAVAEKRGRAGEEAAS